MDISTEKLKLIKWIKHIQDESILDHLIFIKNEYARNTDWWDEISTYEKQEIEAGIKDSEAGRTVLHEDAQKVYKKYL